MFSSFQLDGANWNSKSMKIHENFSITHLLRMFINRNAYTHMPVCLQADGQTYIPTYTYIHVHVYIKTYIYVYTYRHTYIHI